MFQEVRIREQMQEGDTVRKLYFVLFSFLSFFFSFPFFSGISIGNLVIEGYIFFPLLFFFLLFYFFHLPVSIQFIYFFTAYWQPGGKEDRWCSYSSIQHSPWEDLLHQGWPKDRAGGPVFIMLPSCIRESCLNREEKSSSH